VARFLLLVLVVTIIGGPESVPAAAVVSFVLARAPGTARVIAQVPGLLGLG
jgi:hypothetical protein